jgi:hypothetical protein
VGWFDGSEVDELTVYSVLRVPAGLCWYARSSTNNQYVGALPNYIVVVYGLPSLAVVK